MFNNHISDNNLPNNWEKPQQKNGDMEQVNLDINPRLNRQLDKLDPLTLKPETATFEDIKIHAKTEQYLSEKTINKRITYLKYMEQHEYPVDLRKADEINFIRHIRYRLYYEQPPATVDALRHERLAFNMLRKAYGLSEIELKLPRKLSNKKMILPLPDTVRELWKYEYYKNQLHTKLFQYLFRTSFLIGMRAPSELANLREQDIVFNSNGTAILTIHEDKEFGRERTLVLPVEIATDYRQKSLLNWMKHWRPRIINENCDAIFPKRNGDYWNAPNLGKYMRNNGKQVWEPYHPYVSRHWSCCARLIEQYHTTKHWNTLVVKEWHGHDKIKNTEKYIKYARQYYQIDPSNWIQRVLKAPYQNGRGKHVEKIDKTPKNPSFEWNSFERTEWARPHPDYSTEEKLIDKNLKTMVVDSTSYSFSFFLELSDTPDMNESIFASFVPCKSDSFISSPIIQSNSCESYFFNCSCNQAPSYASQDYILGMDQQNLSVVGYSVFVASFFKNIDLCPSSLYHFSLNNINLELFNYGKRVTNFVTCYSEDRYLICYTFFAHSI